MPDFFVVGAPKSGTTALHKYLSRHPAVFMPEEKEPSHYSTDFNTHNAITDPEQYRELFAGAPSGALTGEASSHYLFSTVAIPAILRDNPAAKLVAVLRNPITAARSMHSQSIMDWIEDIGDFEKAWDAQERRAQDPSIARRYREPQVLQYGPFFKFADQLKRMFAVAPRKQCHVIIYEEFFSDPARHYNSLQEFLGLSIIAENAFESANRAAQPRSLLLHRLLAPRMILGAMEPGMRQVARSFAFRPRKLLRDLNSVPRRNTPLSPEFRERLKTYFESDVCETEKLLDKDLSVWRAI